MSWNINLTPMEKTINEKLLKISSRFPYPEEIELGEDLTVTINKKQYIFNCVSTQDKDNQDGTIDRIYILKTLVE